MVLTCELCDTDLIAKPSSVVDCGHTYHNECLPSDDVCQTCYRKSEHRVCLKMGNIGSPGDERVSARELKLMIEKQKQVNHAKNNNLMKMFDEILAKRETVKLFEKVKSFENGFETLKKNSIKAQILTMIKISKKIASSVPKQNQTSICPLCLKNFETVENKNSHFLEHDRTDPQEFWRFFQFITREAIGKVNLETHSYVNEYNTTSTNNKNKSYRTRFMFTKVVPGELLYLANESVFGETENESKVLAATKSISEILQCSTVGFIDVTNSGYDFVADWFEQELTHLD